MDRTKVLQQAQMLASRGQYEHAVGEWKKLAAESPHDGSIYNSIGDLHLKRNAMAEAVTAFLKAAEAFKNEGATLKAIAAYKKVLKCDPTKYEVYQHLGDLNVERGLISNAVQDYLAAAKHCLKARKPKEALALYQKIVKIDPSNRNAQQRIAELCVQDNQQEEAIKVYLQLGRERSAEGRHEEAKEAYQAVLNLDPQNSEAAQYIESFKKGKLGSLTPQKSKEAGYPTWLPEPLGQLAEVVRRMDEGQYDGAEAILNQMLSREPGNPQVCQLLARLHLQRGDLQVALGEYRFLASAALRAQDFRLAESLITEFLSQQPDSVPILELYGELYEEQNDPASAALQYAKAIELLLTHPEPGMEGYHEELFEKVRSLSPDKELVERLAAKIRGETITLMDRAIDQETPIDATDESLGRREELDRSQRALLDGEASRDHRPLSSRLITESDQEGGSEGDQPAGEASFEFERETLSRPGRINAEDGAADKSCSTASAVPPPWRAEALNDVEQAQDAALEEQVPLQAVASSGTDRKSDGQEAAGGGRHERNREGAQPSHQRNDEIQPSVSTRPAVTSPEVPDYEAHFTLGVAYKNMGLYSEAREEFGISRQANMYYLDSCLMAALCFKEEGRLAEAIQELEALLTDPRCRGAKAQAIRYELGLLYEAGAQWGKAMVTFEAIPSFHDVPERLTALKRRGKVEAKGADRSSR
ncbi:MAG: tetratricopeptide repeat protein [Nitrospira sp.]|nr:tetratricopeptide repeat protein [Nitrospira sp.]